MRYAARACLLLLAAGCSTPLVVDPGATVLALAFEPGGNLLVGRSDGVVERRSRAGRVVSTWQVGIDAQAFATDPRGGFFVAANGTVSAEGAQASCAITRVDAAGTAATIASFPQGCRALAFDGERVVAAGVGGLVAELEPSGQPIRQRLGDGVVRALLVRDGAIFAAGQSTNGGFVFRLDGWTQRFGAGFFDVAKDLDDSTGNELRMVGSLQPDPAVDRLAGFFAVIGTDGSSFEMRTEPALSAVHAIAGDRVVGHSPEKEFEIGGCPLRSAGGSDVWVSRVKPDGTFEGAWILGSESDEYGYAIAVDRDGRMAVGGKRGPGGWLAILPRNARSCGSVRLPAP